jgi:hypothetical protein
MSTAPAIQLPSGYEDAKPAGNAQVQLPKGYEDATPVGQNVSGPHAGGGKYNSYMEMALGNFQNQNAMR